MDNKENKLRSKSPSTSNAPDEALKAIILEAIAEVLAPGVGSRKFGKLRRAPVDGIGETSYRHPIRVKRIELVFGR